MIVLAVVVLLGGVGALLAGVALDDAGVPLVWVAVGAAPLSLVLLAVGLRRMLPPVRRSRATQP